MCGKVSKINVSDTCFHACVRPQNAGLEGSRRACFKLGTICPRSHKVRSGRGEARLRSIIMCYERAHNRPLSSASWIKRKSRKVRMDPGQDPTADFFSGLIVIGTVNICCTKRSSLYAVFFNLRHTVYIYVIVKARRGVLYVN